MGGMGGVEWRRTAVERAVDLSEVYARVRDALKVVEDFVPCRFKVSTMWTIGRKVLDKPRGRSLSLVVSES